MVGSREKAQQQRRARQLENATTMTIKMTSMMNYIKSMMVMMFVTRAMTATMTMRVRVNLEKKRNRAVESWATATAAVTCTRTVGPWPSHGQH